MLRQDIGRIRIAYNYDEILQINPYDNGDKEFLHNPCNCVYITPGGFS